jgi:hypothetical protein
MRGPQEALVVTRIELPPVAAFFANEQELVDIGVTDFTRSLKGRITRQTEISLNGHFGREIEWVSSDAPVAIRARIFGVCNRLYRVVVIHPAGQEPNSESTRFLGSFRLTGS